MAIIGIFDGQLKIIRADKLNNSIAWDSNGTNDWSKSSLQAYLNGEYLNNMNSISKGYISDYVWKLGGVKSFHTELNSIPQSLYEYERGTNRYDTTKALEWNGKVALMYASDYGFATIGSRTSESRDYCLSKSLYNWADTTLFSCVANNWLHDSSSQQWTLTPSADNGNYALFLEATGWVNSNMVHYQGQNRPTVYLNADVDIASGTGSDKDPYILKEKI